MAREGGALGISSEYSCKLTKPLLYKKEGPPSQQHTREEEHQRRARATPLQWA